MPLEHQKLSKNAFEYLALEANTREVGAGELGGRVAETSVDACSAAVGGATCALMHRIWLSRADMLNARGIV